MFRVCLIFSTHTILRTSKSIGNNTMKKMLLATALALFITGCAQQTFTVQNKPARSSTKGKPSPIISSLSGIKREEKLSMQPKLWRRRKCYKNRNPANIRKWIARFYYFRHLYSAGSACIAHNNCTSCPSIWATLSALLINILLGSFQLFCIVISLSLRVK